MSNPSTPLSPLSLAALRTLAYFDIFDYPPTVNELWRWLWPDPARPIETTTLEQLQSILASKELSGRVIIKGDRAMLAGREGMIETHESRQAANAKKWKRALSAARFLELVPFVKLVGVANTLAINNARPKSDIDFFIITSRQHLWIARFIVTGIISLLGWRRHGLKITDRICLSFYITTAALDLAPLKSAEPDPHFAFWTAQIVPLMDDYKTYEKFQAANGWVLTMLPNAWTNVENSKLQAPNNNLRSIKRFYELFFSSPIGVMIENWARTRQLAKMESNLTSKSSEPTTDVIISEDVLKFHEADRRGEYNRRVQEKLRELGL